ncbi:hypothetical protein ACHAW5_011063, partial [Stephanodiscus triporus]
AVEFGRVRRRPHPPTSHSQLRERAGPNEDAVVEIDVGSTTARPEPRRRSPDNNNELTVMMRALGTSPRRVALSFLSASGIALAGNFLGVTSKLLTAIPEATVEASGLDLYFPRGEFKRCRARGYTFVIPSEWVADTFVELAKAQRDVLPLDLQMKRAVGGGTLPDSAYGPPGRLNRKGVSESGDTNVSVIVTGGMRGFSLRMLGGPEEAAEKLLRLSIAPEGSGRVATLLSAVEDKSRGVYVFEFNVDRGLRGSPIKNLSVVASTPEGDKLITLTVAAPLQLWDDDVFDRKCRKIASSFHLT